MQTERYPCSRNRAGRVLRDRASVPGGLYVSTNTVVGLSLNMPVSVCRPTRLCRRACYARVGPISFGPARARQEQNVRRAAFLLRAPEAALVDDVRRVASAVDAAGLDVLRVNGSGDLTAGLVRFLNEMSSLRPDIQLWVATRKLDLAARVLPRTNVHLMLSADRSTPKRAWAATCYLRQVHGRAFIAWMRTDAEPVPDEVDVILNEHVGACRKDWPVEPRTCQKTVRGGAEHLNACLRCRFCFDGHDRGLLPREVRFS